MKIRKNAVLFVLSSITVFVYLIYGVTNSPDILSVFGAALVAAALTAGVYSINTNAVKPLLAAAALTLIVTLLSSLLTDGAPLYEAVMKSLSSAFFLLPSAVAAFEEKRGRTFIIALLYSALTLPALRETVSTYYYIYGNVADYPSFLTCMTLTALMLLLTALSELVFNTKRNYLSLALLLSSTVFSYLGVKAEGDNPLFSPLPLTLLLTFLIYLSREEKRTYQTERRNIVLSTMKIQEIEHLRKKRKPRVYEIPPNLPLDDTKGDPE